MGSTFGGDFVYSVLPHFATHNNCPLGEWFLDMRGKDTHRSVKSSCKFSWSVHDLFIPLHRSMRGLQSEVARNELGRPDLSAHHSLLSSNALSASFLGVYSRAFVLQ